MSVCCEDSESLNWIRDMQEVHYCRLDSQSNVYGLAKVAVSPNDVKMLVTSLRGKVMSVAFQKTAPSSREVHFTYIPGDAEVISLDAFSQTNTVDVVVAIAFMKSSLGKLNNYLNIYSDWDSGRDVKLDQVALGCQSLELNFVPYQLYHTEICHDEQRETVVLLSGGDGKMHMFREAKNTHMFVEEQIDECFPELVDLPGIVTRLHCVCSIDSRQRLTAFGCQNGYVAVALVDLSTKAPLKMYQVQHDSPITSVRLFTQTNYSSPLEGTETSMWSKKADSVLPIPLTEYHLVVASALELAVVYTNVVDRGLNDIIVLPDSDMYDCVTCLLSADVDFDGKSEILLGTYGQELLLYKFQPRPPLSRCSSNLTSDELAADSQPKKSSLSASVDSCRINSNSGRGEFVLVGQRSFPDPILALDEADMTGDGLREIVALSLRGLHVFQHDLKAVAELCLHRLQTVSTNSEDQDSSSLQVADVR